MLKLPLEFANIDARYLPMRLLCCLLFSFALFAAATARTAALPHRILIVATNTATFNGQKNGTFLIEIAYPYAYWRSKGLEVQVVTPLGGPVALYHKGDTLPGLRQHIANPEFQQAMAHSLRPQDVQAEDYSAIYYPGGYGAFVDVCTHKKIAKLAARIHAQGGWLSSAGHGAAALTAIRSQGKAAVAGAEVSCFPTWAEQAWMTESDYGKALPFDMEARLRSLGAVVRVPAQDKPKDIPTVVDDRHRIMTAAFADNALLLAEELAEYVTMPKVMP